MSLVRATLFAALLMLFGAIAASAHQPVKLLDRDGEPVLATSKPISVMTTCLSCHDTDSIANNHHALMGLDPVAGGTAVWPNWMIDPRPFEITGAQWEGIAGWLKTYGDRYTGGIPLKPPAGDTGETGWSWEDSGVPEFNCFLCHTADPDNAARIDELRHGRFDRAVTATLLGTGIVSVNQDAITYDREMFAADGSIDPVLIGLQRPTSQHCGMCHGLVDYGAEPLHFAPGITNPMTERTGEVFSPQRPSMSAMNIRDKDELTEPWDVHIARLVDCMVCHHAPNNPEMNPNAGGVFSKYPDHNLYGSGSTGDPAIKARRCEDCHITEGTHTWLIDPARHMAALACEACHIPALHAPARMMTDWTVVGLEAVPQVTYRGLDGPAGDPLSMITNYEPVLLERSLPDGSKKLFPYNLECVYYWVDGEGRPVDKQLVFSVLETYGGYTQQVLDLLDADGDGELQPGERRLDGKSAEAIAGLLAKQGVDSPRIHGEIRLHAIHHNVVDGDQAVRNCEECHGPESRLTQPFALAEYYPGGVSPVPVEDPNISIPGFVLREEEGTTVASIDPSRDGLYVMGHDRSRRGDILGLVLVLLVLMGAGAHGLARIVTDGRRRRKEA